jgi:hypothetical protein
VFRLIPSRHLLWVDCVAALSAGVAMFGLARWLGELYAMPLWAVRGMAGVNIAYGLFSLSLASRTQRPRALIVVLVMANAAWAVVCGIVAITFFQSMSLWAVLHWAFEGCFVRRLAAMEWKERDRLLFAAAPQQNIHR